MPTAPLAPTPFKVTFPDGTTENLAVKALSITDLYKWLYLAKDQSEPAMVALVVGKDLAWIDTLDVDQFATLAALCNKINFPQAVRLAEKGAAVAAALVAPLMQRFLLGNQVISILSTGSGKPLPTPAPLASATAIQTESPAPSASTASVPS